ncbi:hypothetical protein, partial [Corynebacterium spheniscorum]
MKDTRNRPNSRLLGRRALAALTVPVMGIGTITLPALTPEIAAVASAQETGDPAAQPDRPTTKWDVPAGAKVKGHTIIQSGVTFAEVTGEKSFDMRLTYRATLSPAAWITWVYLHFDPDLAPYIDEISVKNEGISPNAKYTRWFEKVTPTTVNNVGPTGKPYGELDPYANSGVDGEVWRALNDLASARVPTVIGDKYERKFLSGNWGIFPDVPLQNQKHTGMVHVTLKKPIEQIIKETGKTQFDAEARWQGQNEDNSEINVDATAQTGTTIDFDPAAGGSKGTTWLDAQSLTYFELGKEPGLMGPDGKFVPVSDGKVSVLRTKTQRFHNIATYNTAVGAKKPFDVHLQIDPAVLAAVDGDHVTVWEVYNSGNYANGASETPVQVPVSAFDENGVVRITQRQELEGSPNTVVIDDIHRVIQPNASDPVVDGMYVDIPIVESKLIENYSDPTYFKSIHFAQWVTADENGGDRLIDKSNTSSYWRMYVTYRPTVANISAPAEGEGDAVTAEKNTARQSQNFLQGNSEPNSEVTVYRITGENREVVGHTTADESGNWAAKICDPATRTGEDPNSCPAVSLESLGLTAEGATSTLAVAARAGMNAESADVPVTITKVESNAPTTDYTKEAPFDPSETNNILTGKLAAQHQNGTQTKVQAYVKTSDGSEIIVGETTVNGNATETPEFKLTVDPAKVGPAKEIFLRAIEGNLPADPTAPVERSRDDAYFKSAEVSVPVEFNGPTISVNPVAVTVEEGDEIPADTVLGTVIPGKDATMPTAEQIKVEGAPEGVTTAFDPETGKITLVGSPVAGTAKAEPYAVTIAIVDELDREITKVDAPIKVIAHNGVANTTVKITDTVGGGPDGSEPDGIFTAGEDVVYTATTDITEGGVKDLSVVIDQDPDAPFKADAVPTVTKDGVKLTPDVDYTATKQPDGSFEIDFKDPVDEGSQIITTIDGQVAAEKPADGDGVIGGDGYKPGTTDPDGEGEKPEVPNTLDPSNEAGNPVDYYIGKINTVVGITDADGDGVFSAGDDVTYTATSTVVGGPVEKPVIVLNQDADAPFKADAVPTVTKNGQPVPQEDYTAEVVDGKLTVSFKTPLEADDVIVTKIDGQVAKETPEGGDGIIGGDDYQPGTTDPDAEGPKDPTANVKDPDTNTGKPVDLYPGKIDTVVKITDTTGGGPDGTEPDGKFAAGEGVTYTGTSTVTGGSVEKPVIVINQDPDAPFNEGAVPTVTK